MDAIEHIMESERTILLETIKTRIRYIIQSVETLLDNDGILQIAGALYIHAVEEYGKFLFVQNLTSTQGIVSVERNPFYNHNFKINLAKNDLPNECFSLKVGGFSSSFQRGAFSVDEIADWKTRLTIFNTDLENGRTPQLPEVNPSDLRNAVNKFKTHLNL